MDCSPACSATCFTSSWCWCSSPWCCCSKGLYLTWNAYKGPEAKRIEQRLRAMSAGGARRGGSLDPEAAHAERGAALQRCCWACRASRSSTGYCSSRARVDRGVLPRGSRSRRWWHSLSSLLSFVPYPALDVRCADRACGVGALPLLYVVRKRDTAHATSSSSSCRTRST